MYASVVVPTYNRRRILERTLPALLEQTVPTDMYGVIVVDDSSSDGTQDYLQRMADLVDNLTCILHTENQGRTITRNDGIETASGEIVIFLDDDNVPDRHLVEAHIKCHEQNAGQHVAVMGNARFASEVIGGSNFGRYLQSRYLGCRPPRERVGIDYSNLPPRCFGTLNCSVRRTDLLAVGMFDTDFRYYGGEDAYMGHCLRQTGVRLAFCEEARSLHYDVVSIPRYKSKMLETAQGGHRTILDKGPEYFEDTQTRFLLPVDWKRDSFKRATIKLGIRAFLNPAIVFMLEHWAVLTDRCSWLYFQPLFRLLTAGWVLQGYRSKQPAGRLVRYGENETG